MSWAEQRAQAPGLLPHIHCFPSSAPQEETQQEMLGKTCDPGMLLEERGGSSGWICTLPGAWERGD